MTDTNQDFAKLAEELRIIKMRCDYARNGYGDWRSEMDEIARRAEEALRLAAQAQCSEVFKHAAFPELYNSAQAQEDRKDAEMQEPAVLGAWQFTPPKAPASMSFHVDADQVEGLMVFCSMDDANEKPSAIQFNVGVGHGGFGLYVSLSDYPDEGSIFLAKPAIAAEKGEQT